MGRPFAGELESLPENISFALDLPVDALRDTIESATIGRILACGAGGSFSAASFIQLLFSTLKVQAQTVTPLHFIQSSRPQEPTTLILFSAGGRNKDVLRVIEHARGIGISMVLICATKDTPAARLIGHQNNSRVFEFSYPAKKDGFLAVNSLAVTWWLVARAFGFTPPDVAAAKRAVAANFEVSFVSNNRRHACLIIHDRWTMPVAIDLESKMSEAALCAPLICDWRQFGHGRHNWLAKNASFSSVLSLETNETLLLTERTLSLLPTKVPQTRLSTDISGVAGTCELLLKSFVFVGALGKQVGIDPGRPGVPPFGSALYRLPAPRALARTGVKVWNIDAAAQRKIDAIGIREDLSEFGKSVYVAAKSYLEGIKKRKFGAVVLDFDGTTAASGIKPEMKLSGEVEAALIRLLRGGIIIGIATGRGDSCHQNLTNSIPEPLRDLVYICHYNGASIGNLKQISESPIRWSNNPILLEIQKELARDLVISKLSEIQLKGPQITLRTETHAEKMMVEKSVRTFLSRRYPHAARLVASSHTLDIVPIGATKLALIEFLRKNYVDKHDILAIGDRGDLGGNDFELLSTPFSLSVDEVSADLKSCWNFLPRGISHQRGTAIYLESFKVKKNHFVISSK